MSFILFQEWTRYLVFLLWKHMLIEFTWYRYFPCYKRQCRLCLVPQSIIIGSSSTATHLLRINLLNCLGGTNAAYKCLQLIVLSEYVDLRNKPSRAWNDLSDPNSFKAIGWSGPKTSPDASWQNKQSQFQKTIEFLLLWEQTNVDGSIGSKCKLDCYVSCEHLGWTTCQYQLKCNKSPGKKKKKT